MCERKYDKKHDILYLYLQNVSASEYFSDEDEDMSNVYVNRYEKDNSIVGFIIFDYIKKRRAYKKIFKKYGIVA